MPPTQERIAIIETRIEHFGEMVENINNKVNELHDRAVKHEGALGERGKWAGVLHSIFLWMGPIFGGLVGATLERKFHGG